MITRLKKIPLHTLFLIDSVIFSLVTAWILFSQTGIMLAWFTLSAALLFYILSFRVSKNDRPRVVKGVIDEVGGRMVHHLTHWKLVMIGKTVEVWTAVENQSSEHKRVVVKFPRQDTDSSLLEIEIDLTAIAEKCHQLSHPNLIQLFEVGRCLHPRTKEQVNYIIEEFVDGYTLQSLIEKQPNRRLPSKMVTQIAPQLLDTLLYIQSQDMVQRTLKLSDIMFDTAGYMRLVNISNAAIAYTEDIQFIDISPYTSAVHLENTPTNNLFALAILISAMYGCALPAAESMDEFAHAIESQLDNQDDVPEWMRNAIHQCLYMEESGQFPFLKKGY